MKFECKLCGDPCVIQCEEDCEFKPALCPFNAKSDADWRKVTEPAALPKLTVETLAERGIEWPEWAGCAAVGPYGLACFMDSSSELYPIHKAKEWVGKNNWEKIPGKWDATDWNNSKIMRPAKVNELPDWCKVGAWAAVGNFVGKIDWLSRDASECRITCGESRFAKTGEVKPVTWRAWTRSEWCEQIGKRFKFADGERLLLGVTWCVEDAESLHFPDCGPLDGKTVFSMGVGEQLNGLPCGVPQVDGADLEG